MCEITWRQLLQKMQQLPAMVVHCFPHKLLRALRFSPCRSAGMLIAAAGFSDGVDSGVICAPGSVIMADEISSCRVDSASLFDVDVSSLK